MKQWRDPRINLMLTADVSTRECGSCFIHKWYFKSPLRSPNYNDNLLLEGQEAGAGDGL